MEDKMLYKDPSQPVDVRVEDLLSRMTLEEKAAQLCGDLAASFIVISWSRESKTDCRDYQ